jgi:protein-tyrosine-phosphatase/putative NADPH-quinone reductase
MLVLCLEGSPRKKGNTKYLASAFLDEARKLGAHTQLVHVTQKNVVPCKELVVCEKKGYCPIDDDMQHEIYPLLRQADVVILASPIFFFNMTAQLKALVDRCQTFWARKYIFKLADPGKNMRRGYVLSVGASRGKSLFDGMELTGKYFFDAIGASYEGCLTYRGIEGPKDLAEHPTVGEEVKKAAADLLKPYLGRKSILFACRENACRSQMASAFAQYHAGDVLDVSNGGSEPASEINRDMAAVMQEKGIDMAYRIPRALEEAISESPPEMIITMGCREQCPVVPGARVLDWDLPDPAGKPIAFMRDIRDEIEKRVQGLVTELT